jgi:hypothetical protein
MPARPLVGPADAGVLAAFAQLLGVVRAGGPDVDVEPVTQLVIQQVERSVRATLATPEVIEVVARFLWIEATRPESVLEWNRGSWDWLCETTRVFWRMKAAGALHAAVGS